MLYQIKDIYKYCRDNNIKMLSTFNGDFWNYYKSNYQNFDRLFKKEFTSWYPMDQERGATLEDITAEFIADVNAFLTVNSKRYAELWRAYNIEDNTAYSLTNNVDYTETRDLTIEREGEDNRGEQVIKDTGYISYGAQTVTGDNERTLGGKITSTENKVSAYNDGTYAPRDYSETNEGQQTDTEDLSTTYGSHDDDSMNTRKEGSRFDSHNEDTTEKETLHKVGNMGVQTVDDMLKKHWDNWSMFDLYMFIFKEIARDLLRGC